MGEPIRYWFRSKTHGWGWGPPATWQGWLVLLAYAAAMLAVAIRVPPDTRPMAFLVWVAALAAALLVVCWFKGEPPRWRWGGR